MSTVLVVEDSRTQRQMICDLLADNAFATIDAGDGREALSKAHYAHPDIVILDIIIPQLNGYEVCRQLKADPRTKDIPVIMCSSKSLNSDHYWGLKNGADAYISKPFQPQELIETVKSLLRKQTA
ncbi:response regulator receiver protein [Cylindrospermum sp. NIES-4074]|nr:response regulator receiver protein [Cylindrospermum sp. NIES-4074]